MSNIHITYLVGAGCTVIALTAFVLLIVAPAMGSYRRPWEKGIALVLSFYVLAALIGVGMVGGYEIFSQWSRFF